MKLGILLKNLSASQISFFAINNINNMVKDKDFDCILFYENITRPCSTMNFASMQIYEAYTYDADIVATCLSTAYKMILFPSSKQKFFYVWDLEWIRIKEKYFRDLYKIYCNPNIKLLARSNEHKRVIEDCWNVKVHAVIEDLNIDELKEVIKNGNN